MRKIFMIVGTSAVLLLCLILGAFFSGPLFAFASSIQAPSTPDTTKTTDAKSPYCDLFEQSLAKRLGISVDKLQQDRQGAFDDVLAQLVKDGKLTQAQADQIKQHKQSIKDCAGIGAGNFTGALQGQFFKKYGPQIVNQVAQGLHLTADQLKTQLKAGKSINDIASAQKVSTADLHTLVVNAANDAIGAAVKAGDLTQTQADMLKQFLQQHPQLLDRLLAAHKGKQQK